MIVALLGLIAGSPGDAQTAKPLKHLEPPPGEGVICAWALYSLAEEVGQRCFAGQNPEFQAELGRTVKKLDNFVMANSKEATPETVARFKADQAHVGAPTTLLCQGDAVDIYRAMERAGVVKIREGVDKAVEVPGKPTWGDCL